ncbi:hypothetical protein [Bifidobacterium phasiani]|uniref:Uncharacterized protein n=1 Tax=Bifidobacterium phasiani TaxID=2834431 RepID=A0ABS6W648_9BIFI|nr:hypothetical protein [Bifidobacterium phasiani]MBW3081953.1 hypothetical protein [Bifidobacterium phasiani]
MRITQYYPNPLFRDTGAKHSQSGNGTMRYQDNHLMLVSADSTGMQCPLRFTGIPLGETLVFRFLAYVPEESTGFRNGCLCTIGYGSWTTVASIGMEYRDHLGSTYTYAQEFTIPSGADNVQFLFNSPTVANQSVTFDAPLLMTKADYSAYLAMQDRPERVYWDLMPLTRS